MRTRTSIVAVCSKTSRSPSDNTATAGAAVSTTAAPTIALHAGATMLVMVGYTFMGLYLLFGG